MYLMSFNRNIYKGKKNKHKPEKLKGSDSFAFPSLILDAFSKS